MERSTDSLTISIPPLVSDPEFASEFQLLKKQLESLAGADTATSHAASQILDRVRFTQQFAIIEESDSSFTVERLLIDKKLVVQVLGSRHFASVEEAVAFPEFKHILPK